MTTRLVGEILKTLGLIACALAIGCGETSGTGTGSDGAPVAPPRTDEDQVVGDDNAGDPADPGDDDPSNDPVDDEASDTPFDDNADDASDAPEPGDEQEDAEPKSTTYLFDCETFVGGLDDLLLDVTVTPFEAFASGLPNSVTLSGSITLTEPIVEGIAGFVEVVDIEGSVVNVSIAGAEPVQISLPGDDFEGFDFTFDTDGNGIPGPFVFDVGPVIADITPTQGSQVSFALNVDSLNLSIAGIPLLGSIDIPDFCSSRNIDGQPIVYAVGGDGGGTGGAGGGDGGSGGSGGSAGDDGGSDVDCDRDRLFDDGKIFNGSFRQRICEWKQSKR